MSHSNKVEHRKAMLRLLCRLEARGQSTPMNLAEQLRHAHRIRRTLAAVARIDATPNRVYAWRRRKLRMAINLQTNFR